MTNRKLFKYTIVSRGIFKKIWSLSSLENSSGVTQIVISILLLVKIYRENCLPIITFPLMHKRTSALRSKLVKDSSLWSFYRR